MMKGERRNAETIDTVTPSRDGCFAHREGITAGAALEAPALARVAILALRPSCAANPFSALKARREGPTLLGQCIDSILR
jgi:hypothetical protein